MSVSCSPAVTYPNTPEMAAALLGQPNLNMIPPLTLQPGNMNQGNTIPPLSGACTPLIAGAAFNLGGTCASGAMTPVPVTAQLGGPPAQMVSTLAQGSTNANPQGMQTLTQLLQQQQPTIQQCLPLQNLTNGTPGISTPGLLPGVSTPGLLQIPGVSTPGLVSYYPATGNLTAPNMCHPGPVDVFALSQQLASMKQEAEEEERLERESRECQEKTGDDLVNEMMGIEGEQYESDADEEEEQEPVGQLPTMSHNNHRMMNRQKSIQALRDLTKSTPIASGAMTPTVPPFGGVGQSQCGVTTFSGLQTPIGQQHNNQTFVTPMNTAVLNGGSVINGGINSNNNFNVSGTQTPSHLQALQSVQEQINSVAATVMGNGQNRATTVALPHAFSQMQSALQSAIQSPGIRTPMEICQLPQNNSLPQASSSSNCIFNLDAITQDLSHLQQQLDLLFAINNQNITVNNGATNVGNINNDIIGEATFGNQNQQGFVQETTFQDNDQYVVTNPMSTQFVDTNKDCDAALSWRKNTETKPKKHQGPVDYASAFNNDNSSENLSNPKIVDGKRTKDGSVAFELFDKPKQAISGIFSDAVCINRKTGTLKKNKKSTLPILTREECLMMQFGTENVVYALPDNMNYNRGSLWGGNSNFNKKKNNGKKGKKAHVQPLILSNSQEAEVQALNLPADDSETFPLEDGKEEQLPCPVEAF